MIVPERSVLNVAIPDWLIMSEKLGQRLNFVIFFVFFFDVVSFRSRISSFRAKQQHCCNAAAEMNTETHHSVGEERVSSFVGF